MTETMDILHANPWLLYLFAGIFGACIGSFLNVVIYRLPIMIERMWKEECNELFDTKIEIKLEEQINLCKPASSCIHCMSNIPFYHNIPLLSYLILRGRCYHCKESFSCRYFLIELVTSLLTVFVVYHYGLTAQAGFAAVFTWLIIALVMIDYEHYILPDNLNFALLWLGLLANVYELFVPLTEAVLGVIIGYSGLWGFAKLFQLLTGKEGMGHGDFKLFAAFGAWVGWQQLPIIIIGSSLVGAVLGIFLIAAQGRDKAKPMPFGPFLGVAGWIVLFYGEWITHQYLNLFLVHY